MIAPSERIRIGDIEIIRLLDGTIRVDGGAMFAVVLRTLWAAKASPDRENRITLALNCYLVRTPVATLLLDTGVGAEIGRRYADFYSYEPCPGLLPAHAELGLGPDAIDVVVNSHLHFDHCGGSTEPDGAGGFRSAFPRAEFFVQRGEIDFAGDPNPRTRASYRREDWEPLQARGRRANWI